MDILNFISWIKGSRVFTTVDPNKTLLPVGIKDNKRGDDYLAGAISVADFITQIGPGQVGPQGPQGVQGVQGIQGNQGLQGNQGIQGNTGAQGTAGNSVTILGSVADLAAFLVGPGASPGANIGDAWILLSDGSLMTWNGTIWFDAGDIQGPPGATGATGATGAQGVQGNQGIQGVQGIQGIQGPAGLPGLFAQTALSTPVTFATGEQSLFGVGVGSLTVPANAFSVGDSFTTKLCGPITCANNQNIRIRVKTNGVTLIDTGNINMPQTTNQVFDLAIDFTITKIGGAGVAELFANSLYSYNKDANYSIEGVNKGVINNTTFNTTINNTLNITAEWISNNAANSIRSQNFVLTKVY